MTDKTSDNFDKQRFAKNKTKRIPKLADLIANSARSNAQEQPLMLTKIEAEGELSKSAATLHYFEYSAAAATIATVAATAIAPNRTALDRGGDSRSAPSA